MKYPKKYVKILLSLNQKFVPASHKAMVSRIIELGRLEQAEVCIMGAIDGRWERKEITDDVARDALALLRISSAKRARIRSLSLSGRYN
jgi:hypothetical protein